MSLIASLNNYLTTHGEKDLIPSADALMEEIQDDQSKLSQAIQNMGQDQDSSPSEQNS